MEVLQRINSKIAATVLTDNLILNFILAVLELETGLFFRLDSFGLTQKEIKLIFSLIIKRLINHLKRYNTDYVILFGNNISPNFPISAY